jgi:hypothetical protein
MRNIEVYEGKVHRNYWYNLCIGEDDVEDLLKRLEEENVRITVEVLPDTEED